MLVELTEMTERLVGGAVGAVGKNDTELQNFYACLCVPFCLATHIWSDTSERCGLLFVHVTI